MSATAPHRGVWAGIVGLLRDVRVWVLVIGCLGLALAFVPNFLRHPSWVWDGDWRQMHFYWESARQTILKYNQVPLWNPYYCGGNVLMAHPHSQFVTPFFVVALLWDVATGYRVAIVGHFLIGALGMAAVARAHRLSAPAMVLAACTFPFCGFFAWHTMGGHFWALGFQLLPWLHLCWLLASRGRWLMVFPGGVVLAWMVFSSGIYSVPFSMLFLGLTTFSRVLVPEQRDDEGAAPHRFEWVLRRLAPVLALVAIGALGVCFSAPKTLPLLDFLADHHRTFDVADDALELGDLIRAFFGRMDGMWVDREDGRLLYRWTGEYAVDMGFLVVPLAVAGLVLARRHASHWWFLALICIALMAGDHGGMAPYSLLRKLPVYKGLHVPLRFGILAVYALSFAAAVGIHHLALRADADRQPHMAMAIWMLVALAAVEPFTHNRSINELATRYECPAEEDVQKSHFHQAGGGAKRMFLYAIAGKGLVDCYEEAQLERTKLIRWGEVEQAAVTPPSAGRAWLAWWSPNSFRIEYDLKEPARILTNQNFEKHWLIKRGDTISGEPVDHQHMLAVDVPAGRSRVVFQYLPWPFILGVALALFGLVGWLVAWRLTVRRQTQRIAAASGESSVAA